MAQIRHVTAVHPATASGLVGRVYRQVERDFGMLAPPVALHAAAPEVLAACWLLLRETLLADGHTGRADREAVAAAVSAANRCPYCVDVHGSALAGLGGSPAPPDRDGAPGDPLGRWAHRSARHGWRDGPPLDAARRPELVGVLMAFQYVNRMVSVFLPESPLPPLPGPARAGARRAAARVLGALARRPVPPGAALDLVPATDAAEPPWAAGTMVGRAVARAGAVFDEAGRRAVPEPVRQLLHDRLDSWTGEPPGLGGWVDEAVGSLAEADRPAGRLALLTAFAPWRVTDRQLAEFRRDRPDDRTLIELTGWASFAVARWTTDRPLPAPVRTEEQSDES